VTVEAGTTLLFNGGLRIWVTSEGTLDAKRNNSNKITFCGITQDASPQHKLNVLDSSNQENHIAFSDRHYK
jgi:hypothetical protein